MIEGNERTGGSDVGRTSSARRAAIIGLIAFAGAGGTGGIVSAQMTNIGAAAPAADKPAVIGGASKWKPGTPVPMISRSVLFGNPERSQGRISPDGKSIAFTAPLDGVMNVWVAPVVGGGVKLDQARAITRDGKRGIQQYFWAYSGDTILYIQDKGGDENWRVHAVSVATGAERDLTPTDNTQARVERVSREFPEQIVIGLNDRDPALHDLYRLNIQTGEKTLLIRNTDGYAGFEVDDQYRVRVASKFNESGGVDVFLPANAGEAVEAEGAKWTKAFSLAMADVGSFRFVGFSKDGMTAYITDSRERDTAALYSMDIKTGKKTIILEDDRADIGQVVINPITQAIEAAEIEYLKAEWTIIDRVIEPDLFAIRKHAGEGVIAITSRTKDDQFWTIALIRDSGPATTWLLERGDLTNPKRTPSVTMLWANKPALANEPLVKMHPVTIKSRDGLELVSYLTLPLEADPDQDGKANKPVPMVLNVHGGPWARDSWGFDPEAQWLANRGYAVLQVNFRASTGFGKKFMNAGNGEWAGKMHDDLLDAVAWAVENKVAEKDKVVIYGGSYGGYAALTGLTFTPEVFAGGVSIVGPSNLVTLLNSIPAYWGPALDLMTKQIGGDHRTEAGRTWLEGRSPLGRVDKIAKPLLIGQGANDPRVKQPESDQIVKKMQEKKIPVTYVLYPDEGHGFVRPTNRLSFYAVAEAFLAQVLGGRTEAIGDAFKGSTIQVPAGAEFVPGVSEAMSSAGK
jgi:dipeptidyl aminopeptidase/acylaminoacyl peptidase